MSKKLKAKKVLAMLAASTLLATNGISSIMASAANMMDLGNLASGGMFYTDYETHAEALDAAKVLNEQIAEEGNVLLKNDGVLPMATTNYVSVFGTADDALIGGYGAVSDSLIEAGFRVNPALKNFYDKDAFKSSSTGGAGFATGGKNIGTESLAFGAKVENTFSLYKDAAVVVFSRNGGEGSDPVRVTAEKNSDEDNVNGWEHANLATDEEGNEYKHYLQFTDSENALLDYVKDRFEKVIVVINTSNAMEMYNLQNDPRINGILLMHRPGANGVSAVGKILSGAVNPSGKTGDTWYRDFSADPTWNNFGNNNQVNSTNTFSYTDGKAISAITGVSYEEGIYVGYKYYETVWAEIEAGSIGVDENGKLVAEGGATGKEAADAWWNANVVYAFGYGLSYTNFDMKMGAIYTDAKLANKLGAEVAPKKFASSVGNPAEVDKLYVPVTVTNTGKVAGKQVAQVYVTAPYTAGEVEKSYVKLVGYAKTDMLAPGESQTVVVSFNVQDFASFDYTDANGNDAYTYELDEGNYEVKLMSDAHNVVDSESFKITGEEAAILAADDFSGNKVWATDFSNPNSEYYTLMNPDVTSSEAEGGKKLYGETANMTLMSRANLVTTAPDEHKASDYIATKALLEYIDEYCVVQSANLDDENSKWALTEEQLDALMEGWDQASSADVAARKNGKCEVLLRDMAGIPLYNEDGTVSEKWTSFMNQLSFDEIAKLITMCSQSTAAIPSIGKLAARNIDGPNSTAGMSWVDETTVSSTWNTDLAYKQGVMVGNLYTLYGYTSWYAPATNLHRSPFGGRNNEYYSEDGIHAGYMAAAAAWGCESRGVNCYVKHFALNDQETNRTNLITFADEQNIRENYFNSFQMALQEGGASALMMTFSRIGIVSGPSNYVALQEIVRNEWGWDGVIGTDFFPYRQSAFTVGTEGEEDYFKSAGGATTCIDLMIRTGGVHPLGNDTTLSATWTEDAEGNGKVVLSESADINAVKALPEYVAPEKGGSSKFVSNGTTYIVTSSVTWGRETLSAKKVGTEESKIDYYYARLQAMRICSVYANSVNIDNGIVFGDNYTFIYDYVDSTRQPQPATMKKTLDTAQVGVDYNVSLAATEYELGEGNVATYSIVKGEIPAGLTFNATTGVLSGRPTEAGEYTFTARATVANNYGEAIITLNVAETIEINGETTIKLGEDVDVWFDNADGALEGYTSMEYTAEGLPAGVEMSANGEISGTPVEAGEYKVVVTLSGKIVEGKNTTTHTYVRELTITVEAEEVLPQFRVNEDGMIQYSEDGGNTWINVIAKDELKGDKGETGATGEQGPQGEKGETGATGEQGPQGEAGKDGKDGQDALAALGCSGSVVSIASLAALALVGGAIALRKKED